MQVPSGLVVEAKYIKELLQKSAMFRGKRGDTNTLTYVMMIEVALIVLLAIGFSFFLLDVSEDTLFAKSHASRDIALLMETVQSLPGDIEVYYSEPEFDVSQFNYRFDDNIVRIFQGDNFMYSIYYPYFLNTRLQEGFDDYTFTSPSSFVMSNVDGVFSVREYGTIDWSEPDRFTCSYAPSTKTTKGTFVVVVENSNLVLESVADYFIDYEGVGFNRKQEGENAISATTDVVLILSVGTQDNVLVEIPNDEQSKKLGCLLANAVVGAYPEADLSGIDETSGSLLHINGDGLAVRVIIGERLLMDANTLGSALGSGLEDYYDG